MCCTVYVHLCDKDYLNNKFIQEKLKSNLSVTLHLPCEIVTLSGGIVNIGLSLERHLSNFTSAEPNPSNGTRGEILCSRVGRPAGEKVPWSSLSPSLLFPTETTHAMQVRRERGREGMPKTPTTRHRRGRSVAGRQRGRKGRKAYARARHQASERPPQPQVPRPADGRIAGAKPTLKTCRRQEGRKGSGWSTRNPFQR